MERRVSGFPSVIGTSWLCRRFWRRARIALCLSVSLAASAQAEVIVAGKGGGLVIGEALESKDDNTYTVKIYRGFSKDLPKAAVQQLKQIDRSAKAERAEFAERRVKLSSRSVGEQCALVKWAREKGLGIQAAALLHELRARDPGNAQLLALDLNARQPAADRERARELVRAYFANDEKAEDALTQLRRADRLSDRDVKSWADFCWDEARKGPKLKTGDQTFKSGQFESQVHIEAWRKDTGESTADAPDAAGTEAWPVLLGLHGGGKDDGNWRSGTPRFFGAFRGHFPRLLFVAPTVMEKNYAEWAGNPAEEYQLKELLKAVKRTWNVDTRHVYVAGVSMGGYGTWHIGGHQSDQFAGLVSDAGGILIGAAKGETWGWGVIGNLMHTPIAFLHGGKDGPAPPWSDAEADRILTELAAKYPGSYRHKYSFYPNGGHGAPGKGVDEAVAYVAAFARESYPRRLLWEPKRSFNRLFYWLLLDQPRIFSRIEAVVDGNVINLKTENIQGGLSILLNEQLVDLARPVKVVIDGSTVFDGRVEPSLSAMVESIGDKLDPEMWFTARLDF